MAPLPFNLALVQFLAGHRTVFLTDFFLAVTSFGGAGVYILIALFIYAGWSKQLAIRLSVLVLLTMVLNDILKMAIKNPRPFVREGTWLRKWAVSPNQAAQLASEYSTPSGHAMGSSAFYSYLFAFVHHRAVRILAVAAIVLVGISRPYLGVHFVEDVLIGWAFGLAIALVSIRYGEAIATAWSRFSTTQQIAATVAGSVALWLLAVLLNGRQFSGQPRNVLYYGGFLTGMVAGRPLEISQVNFDPRSGSILAKTLRYLLSVGMVIYTSAFVGAAFEMVVDRSSMVWNLCEYLRFTVMGFVAVFVAPLLFTGIGWAKKAEARAN